ncbi:MAG TPA: sulfatase [Stenomitos sp.]
MKNYKHVFPCNKKNILIWFVFLFIFSSNSLVGAVEKRNKSHNRLKANSVNHYSKPRTTRSATQPNIIFILTDDLDKISIPSMPKLKSKLIDQGMSFDNFVASTPVCCPSRATLLTGRYSHNTGIKTNQLPDGGFAKFYNSGQESSTIATWLQGAGYETVLIGKYLNSPTEAAYPTYIPPGWNQWYGQTFDKFYYNYQLNENGTLVDYGNSAEHYSTKVFTDKAINFIQNRSSAAQPFFIYLNLHAPHDNAYHEAQYKPFALTEIFPRIPSFNEEDVSDKPLYIQERAQFLPTVIERIDRVYRNRLRSLQSVDDAIQRIDEVLAATGNSKNTYIFFSSDNGFHQGQHRLKHGKGSPYEEDILLPFIVRGPRVPRGVSVQQLVGTTDIAPTLATLANAPIPSFVDGRSFVRILHGVTPTNWRKSYLLENWPKQLAPFYGIRTQDYSYIEHDTNEYELYDLKNDPYQLNNIYSTLSPTVIRQLSNRLKSLKSCTASNCRLIEGRSVPPLL